ncbi:hypothetical protein ACHAWF_008262, partial [Thalassiosira exigua]
DVGRHNKQHHERNASDRSQRADRSQSRSALRPQPTTQSLKRATTSREQLSSNIERTIPFSSKVEGRPSKATTHPNRRSKSFVALSLNRMLLLSSIILAANACLFVRAFAPPPSIIAPTVGLADKLIVAPLRATTETEAERLLQKARELREQVKAGEDELHSTLLQRKKARDAATDAIIADLFPSDAEDGTSALCDRLRGKRLASDALVRVVERLHEREVAARGFEHVEPSVHHDRVTFKRVAQPDEAKLGRIQGLVDRLIEAAEVLDKEFIDEKSKCEGVITHSGKVYD